MKGITHLFFSYILALLISIYIEGGLVFIAITVFFSLFPDIDEHNSKFGKKIWPLSWLLTHRSFFHSLLFPLIIGIILFPMISPWIIIAIITGLVSHMLLDSLTPKGIKPFWPFDYRLKGIIKTSSFLEYLILAIMVPFSVVLTLIYFF